jgi:hypothetical protein
MSGDVLLEIPQFGGLGDEGVRTSGQGWCTSPASRRPGQHHHRSDGRDGSHRIIRRTDAPPPEIFQSSRTKPGFGESSRRSNSIAP